MFSMLPVYFLILLLGLIFGSFISAITYRIPKGQDFVKGRSFCDNCKKNLFWYDNIPLISYIFYKGSSRCCRKPISIRYPLIEISSALAIIFLFIKFPLPYFLIYYVLFLISLTIFVIDLEYQIIPDELSWLIILLFLASSSVPLFPHLFSGLLFSLAILFINLITKGKGMGLGDVKLSLALGMWLGLEKGLTWLTLSFLTGGIIASILLVSGKAKMKTRISFGPFLLFAFWIVLLTT